MSNEIRGTNFDNFDCSLRYLSAKSEMCHRTRPNWPRLTRVSLSDNGDQRGTKTKRPVSIAMANFLSIRPNINGVVDPRRM